MSAQTTDPVGFDFDAGVLVRERPERGMLAGDAGGDPALLVRFSIRAEVEAQTVEAVSADRMLPIPAAVARSHRGSGRRLPMR